MKVKILNNRDNETFSYEIPTKYVNQNVFTSDAYKFVFDKTNEFWDRDIAFTVQITRTYEGSDIFGYPKH